VRIYSTNEAPKTAILRAAIAEAENDPENIDKVSAAIFLLRQRQLGLADVQARLGEIFERRIAHWGRG
jgi:hypothetical protein